MSQPPRKRRKLDETLKDEIKQIVKEVVGEAVPTIADIVAAKLDGQQSRSSNESTQANQTSPVTCTNTDHTQGTQTEPCDESPPKDGEPTTVDQGSSSQGTTINSNIINITGPLHAGRSLSQGVDTKIKGKVWAEEYIELGSLLFRSQSSKLEAVHDVKNGITFVQKNQKYFFKTTQQWAAAFHVFVAIYCEKYPQQSPALMKYMTTVQKLFDDVGLKAALHYDEQFRRWRADSPSAMPWDRINQELHSESLQIGLKTRLMSTDQTQTNKKSSPTFRGLPSKKGTCFSYNNNNGKCQRENCTFQHVCGKCFGDHHRKICPSLSESGKGTPKRKSENSTRNDKSK